MASQPTTHPYDNLESYPFATAQYASWRQLLPAHRLPVLAKTPLLIAVGLYLSGASFDLRSSGLTMVLTVALWAALYAVNEATDLELEHGLHIRRQTRASLRALVAALCAASVLLSWPLAGLLALMAVGQIAYCAPPLRLKRWWWAVLLLSGVLNPTLRLQCGAIWGAHPIPPLAYLAMMGLHLGAAARSRVLLRERDRRLGYHIAPPGTEGLGMACTGIGLLGTGLLCWQNVLPRVCLLLGAVVIPFCVYAWSGRVTNVARLRQGWLWFALLACVVLAVLLAAR